MTYRSFCALVLLLGWAPDGVAADPSREVRELAGEAEALLDALEPKEAVRILERGQNSPSFKRADKSARARLLVTLGRAKAELSNEAGMMRAFRQAVALDPGVRLSKVNTSPKIIAALERARLEAPVASKAPAPKPTKKPKPPANPATPLPVAPKEPAALAWWIEGPMVSGARVRLVIDTAALPKDALVEAERRFEAEAAPTPLALTRSGTTASAVLDLDARPFEVSMTARQRGVIVARAGSKETPIRFTPGAAPSMEEALSSTSPPPTESSSVAAATLDLPPPTDDGGGDATGDPLTLLFTFGMVGVMAAAVIVSVALLLGGPDCDAPPGTGCSEVHVAPLMRF